MKTAVASTSLASYEMMKVMEDLPLKESAVYWAVAIFGPMTREQIAARTGMKEGSACGRVNKLLEKGKLIESGLVVNQKTHKWNKVVDLPIGERSKFPVQR